MSTRYTSLTHEYEIGTFSSLAPEMCCSFGVLGCADCLIVRCRAKTTRKWHLLTIVPTSRSRWHDVALRYVKFCIAHDARAYELQQALAATPPQVQTVEEIQVLYHTINR